MTIKSILASILLHYQGKERSVLHIVYVEKDKEEHENVNRKLMPFKALK